MHIFSFLLFLQPDGVMNYFHTPYLIDMIRYGSETIPDLQIKVPDQFVVPDVRYHLYIPGSGNADVSLFGELSPLTCFPFSRRSLMEH